ncbi:hypothetical protein N9B57_00675 [Verrucomicrobia bacterium]|jgi:hypothetical protein|nr:hypothetical protein [Verrucomicrobiota bacterium]MDA7510232.1 hypothetical protein [Verrucomicrobiota bacterium]MDA7866426.1 hypothetical protein [Verrucomicrobiota bacterium]
MTNSPPPPSSFFELIRTETLPSLGPEVRSGVKESGVLLPDVDNYCESHAISGTQRNLLRSAALLWHDDLDGSHNFSQEINSSEGSFLHGIMHRREPDSSNAKYWFRLVGNHPAFAELAEAVEALDSTSENQRLTSSLSNQGEWEPFAFVDACSRAMQGKRDSSNYEFLQKVQELEFNTLVSQILRSTA